MSSIYEYLIEGPGLFLVVKRWKDKAGKNHIKEYQLRFYKGRWDCECKAFLMNKNRAEDLCKHIKGIKENLKEKDLGILRTKSKFDDIEFEMKIIGNH